MWQFIISGYVPGTDFQFTYDIFLATICLSLVGYLFFHVAKETISSLQSKEPLSKIRKF
jgi:hypothetical protein